MPRRHAESLGTRETKETKDETSAQDALKTTTICRQESSGKLRMEVLQKKKPDPTNRMQDMLVGLFRQSPLVSSY
jgi:hypothetical protein